MSMRTRAWRVVGLSAALLSGLALWSGGQDEPASRRDESSPKGRHEELVEARVREELLKMELDVDRQLLQQAVQSVKMREFSALPGFGFGAGPGAAAQPTEEQRKQHEENSRRAKARLQELQDDYLAKSKALGRVSRQRAELEDQLGEKPKDATVGTDVAKRLDQIERKLNQVLDELKGSKGR